MNRNEGGVLSCRGGVPGLDSERTSRFAVNKLLRFAGFHGGFASTKFDPAEGQPVATGLRSNKIPPVDSLNPCVDHWNPLRFPFHLKSTTLLRVGVIICRFNTNQRKRKIICIFKLHEDQFSSNFKYSDFVNTLLDILFESAIEEFK